MEGSLVSVTWPLDGSSQTCKKVSTVNSISPSVSPWWEGLGVGCGEKAQGTNTEVRPEAGISLGNGVSPQQLYGSVRGRGCLPVEGSQPHPGLAILLSGETQNQGFKLLCPGPCQVRWESPHLDTAGFKHDLAWL